MSNYIDIQNVCSAPLPFDEIRINQWASSALTALQKPAELTLRFVDEDEITSLNRQFRNINKSTNVLAFPANIPDIIPMEIQLLGDVIICPEVLACEAQLYEKPLENHWAHIIIHGILHLLGYDHIQQADEIIMQRLEINLLAQLNIENPYVI